MHNKDRARTPIRIIRGDGRGDFGDSKSRLRGWENREVVPRAADIFGERLYCVRWVDAWTARDKSAKGGMVEKTFSERHYLAPTANDVTREAKVLSHLMERFDEWQARGFIPSRKIEPGAETTRLGRERGWTHWHHLFTPRQLLVNGLFNGLSADLGHDLVERAYLQLLVGRLADWNSKLCRWVNDGANEKTAQTYSNQALNTLANWGVRTVLSLDTTLAKSKPAILGAPLAAAMAWSLMACVIC